MNNLIVLDAISNKIFALDFQLLVDALVSILAVGFLFFLLSYLLWNPARNLLTKRKEKIKNEMETAKANMAEANAMKAEYEAKLNGAKADVDNILAEGRKKALARENQIVSEANEEAKRIKDRAEHEIELEKSKTRDEVKQEMITVASAIAGRFVASELTAEEQSKLIDDALNEMGEETWQN